MDMIPILIRIKQKGNEKIDGQVNFRDGQVTFHVFVLDDYPLNYGALEVVICWLIKTMKHDSPREIRFAELTIEDWETGPHLAAALRPDID